MGHRKMAKRIRTISAVVTGVNFTRCGENLKPLLWVYALTLSRVYETHTCKKKVYPLKLTNLRHINILKLCSSFTSLCSIFMQCQYFNQHVEEDYSNILQHKSLSNYGEITHETWRICFKKYRENDYQSWGKWVQSLILYTCFIILQHKHLGLF